MRDSVYISSNGRTDGRTEISTSISRSQCADALQKYRTKSQRDFGQCRHRKQDLLIADSVRKIKHSFVIIVCRYAYVSITRLNTIEIDQWFYFKNKTHNREIDRVSKYRENC